MRSIRLYTTVLITAGDRSLSNYDKRQIVVKLRTAGRCQLTFIIDKSLLLAFCSQQRKTAALRCFYIKSFYYFVLSLRFIISFYHFVLSFRFIISFYHFVLSLRFITSFYHWWKTFISKREVCGQLSKVSDRLILAWKILQQLVFVLLIQVRRYLLRILNSLKLMILLKQV